MLKNMYALFVSAALLIVIAGGLSALEGAFLSLDAGASANSPEGVAFGGGASLGLDLSRNFAFGMKVAFSHDTGTLGTLEPSALFRLYLPMGDTYPFVQMDFGASIFFEDSKSYPFFLGGLCAGWRFRPGRWYIEPSLRAGYPFIWGMGLSVGLYFE